MSNQFVRRASWTVLVAAGTLVAAASLDRGLSAAAVPKEKASRIVVATPGLQVQLQRGTGPFPQATFNNTPVYFAAQLVRTPSSEAPFDSSPIALVAPLSGAEITSATSTQSFAQSCSLTLADTLVECTLTPPGPTWSSGGPIIIRVRLVSADGHAATALLNFPIN